MISIFILLNVIILISSNTHFINCDNSEHHNEYTKEWAVKVSDPYLANLIALETGFVNKGLVN